MDLKVDLLFSFHVTTFLLIRITDGTSIASEGVCKVVWTIEADLEADQLLYLTGDPIALGSWEPNMAIQMSHVDHSNLWKAEVKVMTEAAVCCMLHYYFVSFQSPLFTFLADSSWHKFQVQLFYQGRIIAFICHLENWT